MKPDLERLRESLGGRVLLGEEERARYAADESIYSIQPLAVAVPKDAEDLRAILAFANEEGVPITPRAGGTSLAGQAVGEGIIVDMSANFERIIEFARDRSWVRVEPGAVLSRLNESLLPFGKQFGPDPSSFESCRIGGMIANNASGAHHPVWGATVDNVVSLTLMLSNGEVIRTAPLEVGSAEHRRRGQGASLEARIYREVPALIEAHQPQIAKNFPAVDKSSSGYRLDKALQGNVFDLGKLICGSEGTLALVLDATLRIVDRPTAKGLLLLYFATLEDAARGVKEALATGPAAVEMADENVVELVRARNPEQAERFAPGTHAILFVEYWGRDLAEVERKMMAGWRRLLEETRLAIRDQATTDPGTMAELWKIRRGIEPMLCEMAGARVPVGFVEDTAVPVERLAEHLRGLFAIFDRYGLKAAAYGHAATGHLHVRPFLDLRDARDRELMARVAAEVFDHTRRMGGTMSGEHGDGLVRSEFLEGFYWETYDAMVKIKRIFDPNGILNPGKKVGARPGQITRNLRAVGGAS